MRHLIGRELPAKTLVVAIDCGKVTHRVMLASGEQGVIGEPVSLPTGAQGSGAGTAEEAGDLLGGKGCELIDDQQAIEVAALALGGEPD